MSAINGTVCPWQRNQNFFSIGSCRTCNNEQASEWIRADTSSGNGGQYRRRRAKDKAGQLWDESGVQHLEELFVELFHLHDLNGNGVLEEIELIKINEKIAFLHYGKDIDTSEVWAKYKAVFRAKLDPNGEPVPYEKFRAYAREVLDGLDKDPEAQEMILEQFVAEAHSGREAFDVCTMETDPNLSVKPLKNLANTLSENKMRAIETLQELLFEEPLFEAPNWRRIADAPNAVKWL